MQKGERVEFRCMSTYYGIIQNSTQPRRLEIGLDGVISIYEVDAKTEQHAPNTKSPAFTIDQLHQVIYGRLSERGENYQVSFIIECKPTK